MAKLYFRYSAMNAGKSTSLMQVAHNYLERGMTSLVIKPAIDTKSGSLISSRIGLQREVNFLIQEDDNIKNLLDGVACDCLLVDEAQFLQPHHVDELWELAVLHDVPVICYGLRTDFQMQGFPGSIRLLLLAHSIEELKTICHCGKKAICNMRIINGKPIFDGEQVAIDDDHVSYRSVCARCYLTTKKESV